MSARCRAAGNSVPGSYAEHMCVVHWKCQAYLGFEDTFFMIRNSYGKNFDDFVPVAAGSEVSGHVEDEEDWNSCDILLSRNANVRESRRTDFMATLTRCHKSNFAVHNKADDVFGLALPGLDSLQKRGRLGRGLQHWRQVEQRSCRSSTG